MAYRCPVCLIDFADYGAMSAHASEAHGIGGSDSSVKPAPGWYPDPANPTAHRYWDGTRWTEHSSGPASGPPAFTGAHSGGARSGLIVAAIVGGIAVILIGLVGAVALVGTKNRQATTTAPVAPTLPPGELHTASDLTGGLLSSGDLGASWGEVNLPSAIPSKTTNTCGQPWPADDEDAGAEFTFELQPDGTEHGHLIENIGHADAARVAQHRSFYASPAYPPCLENSVAKDLADSTPRDVILAIQTNHAQQLSTLGLAELGLPANADGFEVTTHYTFSGHASTGTTEVVHIYQGSYWAVLTIHWCTCAPFPSDSIPTIVHHTLERLQALTGQ